MKGEELKEALGEIQAEFPDASLEERWQILNDSRPDLVASAAAIERNDWGQRRRVLTPGTNPTTQQILARYGVKPLATRDEDDGVMRVEASHDDSRNLSQTDNQELIKAKIAKMRERKPSLRFDQAWDLLRNQQPWLFEERD